MLLILLFVVLTPILYLFNQFYFKRRAYPPGPIPYPIWGNILEILKADAPEDAFLKWREKYGNVYTFWMGSVPIIAFTDYESINETFKKDAENFSGRQEMRDFYKITRGIWCFGWMRNTFNVFIFRWQLRYHLQRRRRLEGTTLLCFERVPGLWPGKESDAGAGKCTSKRYVFSFAVCLDSGGAASSTRKVERKSDFRSNYGDQTGHWFSDWVSDQFDSFRISIYGRENHSLFWT